MTDAARIVEAQRRAARLYTEVFMDDILGEAQRIVPLEEGTLAGSAGRDTVDTGTACIVTGYFSTPYARRQHEELSYRHRPGRRAKYLEEPFKAAVPRYPAGLAEAVSIATRGASR